MIIFLLSFNSCNKEETIIPEYSAQKIHLEEGWNIWSTYVNTDAPVISFFEDIIDSILYIKDGYGGIYSPSENVNTLGNHKAGRAYKIKVSKEMSFIIKGLAIDPAEYPIHLLPEWNYLGYLLKVEMPISQALSAIYPDITFMKDDHGNIFCPDFNLNFIGNMKPGEGNEIHMAHKAILVYDSNSED